MALADDLAAAAAAAQRLAGPGEAVTGVLAAEPASAGRAYLCAFERGTERSWVVLDADGEPAGRRERVRDVASTLAVCEVAEEHAGGGQLEELRQQLAALRITEAPAGIEAAEAAALELERTIGTPPRVASPGWLDAVGAAVIDLERALGQPGPSPFAESMKAAVGLVESFVREVEERYKLPLR